jgi:hypothetical protein
MPTLTRRRDPDARQESWLIHYGDVHVGTIGLRSGNPLDTDHWQWRCGFYPGSEPGDCTSGTAASFDQARGDFEEAAGLSRQSHRGRHRRIPEGDRAWTAWKYAMWGSGCKLPTQLASGQSRCFRGAVIDIKGMSQHVHAAHMEAA